jgi:hypothetical protein
MGISCAEPGAMGTSRLDGWARMKSSRLVYKGVPAGQSACG